MISSRYNLVDFVKMEMTVSDAVFSKQKKTSFQFTIEQIYCVLVCRFFDNVLHYEYYATISISRMDSNKIQLEIVLKDKNFKIREVKIRKPLPHYSNSLPGGFRPAKNTLNLLKRGTVEGKAVKNWTKGSKRKRSTRGIIDLDRGSKCGCNFCVYLFGRKPRKKPSRRKSIK